MISDLAKSTDGLSSNGYWWTDQDLMPSGPRRAAGLRPTKLQQETTCPPPGVGRKEGCLRTKGEPRAGMFKPQGQDLVGSKLDICLGRQVGQSNKSLSLCLDSPGQELYVLVTILLSLGS